MQASLHGKPIKFVEEYMPGHYRVHYEDGGIGLTTEQGLSGAMSVSGENESLPRKEGSIAWPDSKEGPPASTDEMAEIEKSLELLKKKYLGD